MRQSLGSDSAGQGSLAAPSPNPRFPLSTRQRQGNQLASSDPPEISLCAVWGMGGRRGTAGKFRDAARSAGTPAARPLGLGPPPPVAAGGGTQRPGPGAGWGTEGGSGLGWGPAAGRGHLRVLLRKAVGRGAGGGEQREQQQRRQ